MWLSLPRTPCSISDKPLHKRYQGATERTIGLESGDVALMQIPQRTSYDLEQLTTFFWPLVSLSVKSNCSTGSERQKNLWPLELGICHTLVIVIWNIQHESLKFYTGFSMTSSLKNNTAFILRGRSPQEKEINYKQLSDSWAVTAGIGKTFLPLGWVFTLYCSNHFLVFLTSAHFQNLKVNEAFR